MCVDPRSVHECAVRGRLPREQDFCFSTALKLVKLQHWFSASHRTPKWRKMRTFRPSIANRKTSTTTSKEATSDQEMGAMRMPCVAIRLTTTTSAAELEISQRLGSEHHRRLRSRTR